METVFFTLLEQQRHLDWLEHDKIRVDFNEPRIHAALVCAAVSCPKLRAEAYVASQLTAQLENQMLLLFLSDRDKNGIDETGLYLSKIFDWYSADFGNLIHFMQGYNQALTTGILTHEPLHNRIKVRYSHYNWLLNSTENM